jgi:hypothetical protein
MGLLRETEKFRVLWHLSFTPQLLMKSPNNEGLIRVCVKCLE